MTSSIPSPRLKVAKRLAICTSLLLTLSGCEAMLEVPLRAIYKSGQKADKREKEATVQREIKEGFEEYQRLIQKQQAGTATSYELIKIGRMGTVGDVRIMLEEANRNPEEIYNQCLQASARQGSIRAEIEIAHNQIVDSFTASSFKHNNYLTDNVIIKNPNQLQEGLTSAKNIAKQTCAIFPIDEKYTYEANGELRTFGGNNLYGLSKKDNSYIKKHPQIVRDVRVLDLYSELNCYLYDYREGSNKQLPKSRGIKALDVFKYDLDDDHWYLTDPNMLLRWYVMSRLTDETKFRPRLKDKIENHETPNLMLQANELYDAYIGEFGKP